uniref:Uncharacterized protein LOC104215692 n=1 Tax=Nicotiana sylvestris TaxID=4096 RepID=A0A1U7VPN7_NICSY|nr:PREDICTED: uncharacterized protein LOC104215692 [Nicotiana sylvestris]
MVSSSDAPSKDGGSSTSPTIDASHPYFLHPSDSPGMTLVSSVFDGRGYGGWRRSLLIALSAKNKLGFIDGSCSAPASDSTSFNLWTRCNDMVTSWLLNSLSKEIVVSVLYSKSAQALWTDLEDRFVQSNEAKLYHLQKEISDLMQGSSDIVKLVKSLQDERLIQFFMGLNDTYSPVRSNILMMSPLPNINIAYSLLVQDERQREVYVNPQFPGDSSSFLATRQNILGQKSQSSDFKGRKNNLICSHCKKPGHSVDKYYRIIGFPSDFKFTKTTKMQGGIRSNNVQISDTGTSPSEPSDVQANMVQCAGHFSVDPSGSW